MTTTATTTIAPSEESVTTATMKLAAMDSTEHMIGMKDVYIEMRDRPLHIRAHTILDNNFHNQNSDTNNNNASASSTQMLIVHFIRHGQGFHNLLADIATESGITWKQFDNNTTTTSTSSSTDNNNSTNRNPYMRVEVLDAPLTEIGRQQAERLQTILPQYNDDSDSKNHTTTTSTNDDSVSIRLLPKIRTVYVSPHCRTLQTGIIALQQYIGHIPFMAHELLREESGIHLCDHRRSIQQQQIEFPQYNFHTYCINDIDPLFVSNQRETKLQVANRIYQFMEFLSQQSVTTTKTLSELTSNVVEQPSQPSISSIAVVTHSGWLHTLFNAVIDADCDPKLKEWWNTGELRTVQLEFIQNHKINQ